VNLDKRLRSEDERNSATVILISHFAKSHLQIILILKFSDHVLYSLNTISALELLPLRFCHHAIREMLLGATARLRSIRQTLLRTPVLGGPIGFSLGFPADFRPVIYR
jgi:hypothetical protein